MGLWAPGEEAALWIRLEVGLVLELCPKDVGHGGRMTRGTGVQNLVSSLQISFWCPCGARYDQWQGDLLGEPCDGLSER